MVCEPVISQTRSRRIRNARPSLATQWLSGLPGLREKNSNKNQNPLALYMITSPNLDQPFLILCKHERVFRMLLYNPEYLLQIPGVQLLLLKPRGKQGKRELTLTSRNQPCTPQLWTIRLVGFPPGNSYRFIGMNGKQHFDFLIGEVINPPPRLPGTSWA